MALKERRLINKVEILANGYVQVREVDEIYDDTVTPVAATYDENGNETTPAVTDVKSQTFHRVVYANFQSAPIEVQEWITG